MDKEVGLDDGNFEVRLSPSLDPGPANTTVALSLELVRQFTTCELSWSRDCDLELTLARYRRYYSAGIVFMIFALFYAFAFWSWRSRIPFTVLMLQTTIDVSKTVGHVFRVSLIGGLVALAAGAWFSVSFVAVYVKYSPDSNNPGCKTGGGSCSSGKLIGLLIFMVFSFYWLTEVIKNVMHVSVSGVYGSW